MTHSTKTNRRPAINTFSTTYFKRALLSVLAVFLLQVSASAATFTVTNTNDSGAGSLRQGLMTASAEGPTPPSNMFIQAAETNSHSEVRVTWRDFQDEDQYQLISNMDSTPGPMMAGSAGGGGTYGEGWVAVRTLPANTTEFVHRTLFGHTYAICGFKEGWPTCFGPSNFETPRPPPQPASVDLLRIVSRASDSLGVEWGQSSDTVYSRAELRRDGAFVSSRENDADQSVTFGELQPNVTYTVKVCVRNTEQTSTSETCESVDARTLLRAPLTPSSVSVNSDDPRPRSRTIRFTFDNQEESRAYDIQVRLIKGDQVPQVKHIQPGKHFGELNFETTFHDLQPFTDYEAWVIPNNESANGNSAGVGFTTPAEMSNFGVRPLSSDSVLLYWTSRATIGDYVIEERRDGVWAERGRFRVPEAGYMEVIVPWLTAASELRVTWRLASLRSHTRPITATPVYGGAPELVSYRLVRVNGPRPLDPPRTTYVVTFRTTTVGDVQYLLQRKSNNQWQTVASTTKGLLAQFKGNTLYTVTDKTPPGGTPTYRVCMRALLRALTAMRCSESSDWLSEGILRLD